MKAQHYASWHRPESAVDICFVAERRVLVAELPIAPVVLLGYNRPEYTSEVFDHIRRAQPGQLLLVMDGPHPDKPGDAESVKQTRAIVENVGWDCQVQRFYAPVNLGLKNRVSSGLTEVFSVVSEAIILEDDCVPDQSFFRYATELLELYREDPGVGVISGSSRLRGRRVSPYSYDFSADVRIWGWATWARTWRGFAESGDLDASWSPDDIHSILESLPQGSRRKSLQKMMETSGELDSWALPFVVHCLRQGYLNPVPRENLVTNIGFGALSTHTKFESYVAEVAASTIEFPLRHPLAVALNPVLDRVEAERDSYEKIRYPLVHPIRTLARLWRYARLVLGARGSH